MVMPYGRAALLLLVVAGLFGLAGCGLAEEDAGFEVALTTAIEGTGSGEVVIAVGARNVGEEVYPGDQEFGGFFQIREQATEAVVTQMEIASVEEIDPGEEEILFTWEQELEPGSYLLIWSANDYGTNYTSFVVEGD